MASVQNCGSCCMSPLWKPGRYRLASDGAVRPWNLSTSIWAVRTHAGTLPGFLYLVESSCDKEKVHGGVVSCCLISCSLMREYVGCPVRHSHFMNSNDGQIYFI
ncbi:unnamed protein product [Meganyctiphanes norvegica]|uniref:Uncharacterized protein n=1 Tax=Meganyctiphanes norvegica TaxID=48144 RepID=A0AAV2QTM0_MEGNR